MASSLIALLDHYKNHLKIPKNVATWISKEDRFILRVYSIEKDTSVNKELDFLNVLHKHHGRLTWMKSNPFEVTEIISINKNYSSVFLFTSRMQQ